MAPKKKNENKTALVLQPKAKVTKARAKSINNTKCSLKNLRNGIVNNVIAIDRMNEVALAQLVKECPVVITESAPDTVPKKKRGRKKKGDELETAEIVPKKKLKGPTKAQVRTKNTKQTKVITPKQNAPTKKRGPGRPRTRGKPKMDDDSTLTSPSISSGLVDTKTPARDSKKPVLKPSDPTTVNNNDSRRTSVTSASEWSWTKHMSGSSTTTCKTVNSTDFVCIDWKLPELILEKIDLALKDKVPTMTEMKEMEHSISEDSSSSSGSSSSSSRSSSSSSSSENTAVKNTLNLSTSSISFVPQSPTYTPVDQSFDRSNQNINKEVTLILETVAPELISLDLSLRDIENESDSFNMSAFKEKISMFLHEEHHTLLACNFLNQCLLENCYVSKNGAPEIQEKPSEEPDFAKPDVTVVCNKSVCANRNDVPCSITRRRETYDPNDDDDALSLFAESFTGMDSTRLSSAASISCAPPSLEEYVPQPLVKRPCTTVNYEPTVINEPEINHIEAASAKPVCEKQNADSTSIHKEPELNCTSNDNFAPVNKTTLGQDWKQVNNTVTENDRLQLTITSYKYPKHTKSVTMLGVCFFNLLSSCSKMDMCPFPHRCIEEDEFKKRLATLSEEQFFQEYTVLGKWPILRRKYVKCFADECQRRELPKILVEIIVDFLSKVRRGSEEDANIKVQMVESALMYLNSWDLSVCEQLLKCHVGGEVLCDVFIKIIANTQNFSRFKNVFMNLTDFMVRVNRTFDLEVVSHILERVCILPFEAPLAAKLISIIERTDRKIFGNNMMNWFEMMLNNFNKELCNRLLSIKMESVTSEGSKPVSEPCPPSLPPLCGSRGSRELEPLTINQNTAQDHDQRYTSPDTTNTDNVNKPVIEPVIIRTLNHLKVPIRPYNNPTHGPGAHMFPRKWEDRTILTQISRPRMPYMRPQRPRGRPTPSIRPQFRFQPRFLRPDFYGSGPT